MPGLHLLLEQRVVVCDELGGDVTVGDETAVVSIFSIFWYFLSLTESFPGRA